MANEIKVKDAMTKGVLTITPDKTIRETAQKMKSTNIDCLVVMKGKNVVGIITVGDIVKKVVAEGKDTAKLRVQDMMSHPIRTVGPDQSITEASRIMRDLKIKRLPVVKSGKLIGIIAGSDVVKIDPALYEIVREKVALEQQQLICSPEFRFSGECDECGNYSDTLRSKDGKLLCDECFEEETGET